MMVELEERTETSSVEDARAKEFFADLVTRLNVTEFLYDSKGMSQKEYEMWTSAINRNLGPMMEHSRVASNFYCIQKAFAEFIVALKNEPNVKMRKLAVDTTGSKLLIWAEVDDDDRESTRSILYADSVANLKIENLGYSVSATVVEKSDYVPVPSHYLMILPDGNK